MGIKNFLAYVEEALQWPIQLYERNKIQRDASDQNRLKDPSKSADGDARREEKAESDRIGSYFDDLFKLCCTKLKIKPAERSLKPTTGEKRIVQGICVDLSSFCYGLIVDVVSSNKHHVRFQQSPSPVPQDVLDSASRTTRGDNHQQYGEKNNENEEMKSFATTSTARLTDTFGEDTLATVFGNARKKIKKDVFDDLEKRTAHEPVEETDEAVRGGTVFKRTIVDTVLDDHIIDLCATKCFEKIYNVIGPDSIANAHYLSLHYDENSTSCKWYEQYKRRCANQIIISKESRSRIFMETLKLIQARLVFDTKIQLIDTFQKRLTDHNGGNADGVKQLLTDDEFINDVVLDKMRMSRCGPGRDIRRQRYVSGEGEWKCFYTISDLECKTNTRPEETHHEWYVFGNDSDIGLGVLLYTSGTTKIHYVNSSNKRLSFTERCMSYRPDAYKALHFLSLCLLGNDYVPRLVNESVKNATSLGTVVRRMIYSDEVYCQKYVELLSNVFRGDNLHYEGRDDRSLIMKRLHFSKAIAYVFGRMLLAVYSDAEDLNSVEECFARHYGQEAAQDGDCSNDRKSLRCKDGRVRTFKECFSAFACCSLWYMAYCLFYRNMDQHQRHEFQTKHFTGTENDCDSRLYVPGLPMKTIFTYNERRLHKLVQFELANIIDMRRTIRDLSTFSLIGSIENNVFDILEK